MQGCCDCASCAAEARRHLAASEHRAWLDCDAARRACRAQRREAGALSARQRALARRVHRGRPLPTLYPRVRAIAATSGAAAAALEGMPRPLDGVAGAAHPQVAHLQTAGHPRVLRCDSCGGCGPLMTRCGLCHATAHQASPCYQALFDTHASQLAAHALARGDRVLVGVDWRCVGDDCMDWPSGEALVGRRVHVRPLGGAGSAREAARPAFVVGFDPWSGQHLVTLTVLPDEAQWMQLLLPRAAPGGSVFSAEGGARLLRPASLSAAQSEVAAAHAVQAGASSKTAAAEAAASWRQLQSRARSFGEPPPRRPDASAASMAVVAVLDHEPLYCFCRMFADGRLYVLCEACREWVHPECVGADPADATLRDKYVCPACAHERNAVVLSDDEASDGSDSEGAPERRKGASTAELGGAADADPEGAAGNEAARKFIGSSRRLSMKATADGAIAQPAEQASVGAPASDAVCPVLLSPGVCRQCVSELREEAVRAVEEEHRLRPFPRWAGPTRHWVVQVRMPNPL